MIKVWVTRGTHGHVEGFSVRGHAGFARAGKDIVCAAVSAVTEGTLLGLLEVAQAKLSYRVDEKKGELVCRLASTADGASLEKAWVLLDTMLLVLREIEKQYPRHVVVEESVHRLPDEPKDD